MMYTINLRYDLKTIVILTISSLQTARSLWYLIPHKKYAIYFILLFVDENINTIKRIFNWLYSLNIIIIKNLKKNQNITLRLLILFYPDLFKRTTSRLRSILILTDMLIYILFIFVLNQPICFHNFCILLLLTLNIT